MLDVLVARWKQGRRTMRYPAGPPPELPERFAGRPVLNAAKCTAGCPQPCIATCPTGALSLGATAGSSSSAAYTVGRANRGTRENDLQLDTGRCLFCRECEKGCAAGAISFSREYRLAASRRQDLVVTTNSSSPEVMLDDAARKMFGRSLKLRQVCAGGCGACEADTNVLGTVAWDLGRFGIQFVASPRHADGLLITGPVTENMRLALKKTYDAVPWPKLVIAVGSCAIAGGPYVDHAEVHNGSGGIFPIDLFIPGCPPHPLTILDGLLALLGRV